MFIDDKIKGMREPYDRLLMTKQLAKGWPATWVVNMVVKQTEKALK